jgi:hypothetical protein
MHVAGNVKSARRINLLQNIDQHLANRCATTAADVCTTWHRQPTKATPRVITQWMTFDKLTRCVAAFVTCAMAVLELFTSPLAAVFSVVV